MSWSKAALIDSQRAVDQGLCFSRSICISQDLRQVVEHGCHGGVVSPQGSLVDGKRPADPEARADYAALVRAGEPINNRRVAELMGCSPGEASRRVAQLEGAIRKGRKGREVLISLN